MTRRPQRGRAASQRHPSTSSRAPSSPRIAAARSDRSPTTSRAGRLQVMSFGCEPFNELTPHELGVTHWFSAPAQAAGPLQVRLEGRLVEATGPGGGENRFSTVAGVDMALPGTGPIAVTARIGGLTPGRWQVTASPVHGQGWLPERERGAESSEGTPDSRGRTVATGTTTFAPVARVRAPGVRLGAWPALVGTGAVAALVVQGVLAGRVGLTVTALTLLSLAACLVGVVGGKTYYLLTHRGESRGLLTTGMSIQGFVIASVATLALGALALSMPLGRVLDVTVPGLLYGMSIGRWGCFLGGCCAGRPTASRWGLWSSDRRLGMRRVPVQLLESGAAAVLGAAATAVVWRGADPAGVTFVAALAAYILVRQVLFPLRVVPRLTRYGRAATAAGAVLVLAVDATVALTVGG